MKWLLIVLAVLLGAPLWAQTDPPVEDVPPTPTTARPENAYVLQSEDVLRIRVYDETQVDAVVQVDPQGNISAPFVGTVRAAGLTVWDLEQELVRRYFDILGLREPIVSITIERFRPLRATVGGAVARPGTYDIRVGDSLLTLLSLGGGVLPNNTADLRRATLRRKGSEELIPIDLNALINKGDVSQNYELKDGDELTVPQTERNLVAVTGQIRNPGLYPYREGLTLAEALNLAGGEIPFKSRFSRITILRRQPVLQDQYIRIQADLVKFYRKGEGAQNVLLRPGDVIFVPDAGNPDFNQINAIANVFFILDRFGLSLFGG